LIKRSSIKDSLFNSSMTDTLCGAKMVNAIAELGVRGVIKQLCGTR
jgi:hypothetical protein